MQVSLGKVLVCVCVCGFVCMQAVVRERGGRGGESGETVKGMSVTHGPQGNHELKGENQKENARWQTANTNAKN